MQALRRSWDWLNTEPSMIIILATAILAFALLTAVAAAARWSRPPRNGGAAPVHPQDGPSANCSVSAPELAEAHKIRSARPAGSRAHFQRRFSLLGRRIQRNRKIRDNLLFLSRWISAPLKIGAVTPSSRRLGRAMAAQLPAQYDVCVELGGGTGSLTRALLSAGMPREKLIVVERDRRLAAHLRKRFHGVRVVQGDAQNLSALLRAQGIEKVDAVFSSLPLRSLPRRVRRSIVAESFATLGAEGIYVQYTYGLLQPPVPDEILKGLSIGGAAQRRVWRNLPPAVVWRYRRIGAASS